MRENVRQLEPTDRPAWLTMRERLWPAFSREELTAEEADILAEDSRTGVLVAVAESGELIGFAEVSIRDWAEGCRTRPVGYLEAWYVEPAYRRTGVGKRLIEAAERWAADRGCTEMASNADPENVISLRAHAALGFTEVGRAVLYAKKLPPDAC